MMLCMPDQSDRKRLTISMALCLTIDYSLLYVHDRKTDRDAVGKKKIPQMNE